MNQWAVLFVFQITNLHVDYIQAVSAVVGSPVTLQCPLIPNGQLRVKWFKGTQLLSVGNEIPPDVPKGIRDRLSITVDSNGKYDLTLSNLIKTDQGEYQCVMGGSIAPKQTLTVIDIAYLYTVSSVLGSTVTLNCSIQPTIPTSWSKGDKSLSYGSNIQSDVEPEEFKKRLSITVDSDGKCHLTISNLTKTDEGTYQCIAQSPGPVQTLTAIIGPTSVDFENRVDNKLQGTEGQDLKIRCIAEGGDPKPNVIIQIGSSGSETLGTGGVKEHAIPAINRSYDSTPVSCSTDYPGVQYQPLTVVANIYLDLKPLPPTFSADPISTEDTKALMLTCTSTGSRPAPIERIWLLGDSRTDITSNATLSSSPDSSKADIYKATSTLTYTVHKHYNGKSITCGFKNIASGNTFIQSSKQIDVKYAPSIAVPNKTLELTQTSLEIQCQLDGNPPTYTYKSWEHRSKYGKHIRYLNAAPTITLRPLSEDVRYQETGVYVCTATNGIVNSQGQLDQNGSGYVISKAPPFYLNGSSQTVLGQTHKDVKIDVSVYSEPKFTGLTWFKEGSPISHGSKYMISHSDNNITTIFHGVNVQVDGYRLTLTITNIQKNDCTNYTVRIDNGIGQPIDHDVLLKSVGPPDPPTHLNVTDIQTSSILVKWKPGLDGESAQKFVIQYRQFGTILWNSIKAESPFSQYDNYWLTIKGLTEGTGYALRMYAKNIFNSSSYSDVLEITTMHSEENNGCQSVVAGIAGGLSSMLLLSVVSNVVLFLRLKTWPCKGAKDQHKSPVAEYEELGMRDQPNVYSQVDNSQQQRDDESHLYSNQE